MKRVASKARVKGTVVPGNEMIPREVVTINPEGTVEASPGYDIEEAIDPKTGIVYYFSASTGRSAWSREDLVAGGFETFDASKRSMLLEPDSDPEARLWTLFFTVKPEMFKFKRVKSRFLTIFVYFKRKIAIF